VPTPSSTTPIQAAVAGEHYENFPVASWLCPPRLRPPIAALYAFARTADDLADEGDTPADQRLADLAEFRADLLACAVGRPSSGRWPAVFTGLHRVLDDWKLPVSLLEDLLDAFTQDVVYTRDARTYADRAELLNYCRRSANPVGRLLLHLYGVKDNDALDRSDAICTALQLINFWQDLSRDIPSGRHYLTDADCRAHGVARSDLNALRDTPNTIRLIAECSRWSCAKMENGAPLVHQIQGRAGWELRLVVQGGLRILGCIEATGFTTLTQRPALRRTDLPRLIWGALRM
jgi:squalene synthase HpnC